MIVDEDFLELYYSFFFHSFLSFYYNFLSIDINA